jgi:SAM-dependent methyltransferase
MSYDAELYAQLHQGTPGDVEFYVDAMRDARHVLELGCGYGRILTALARAGHHVTGLDSDAGMITLAKKAGDALEPEAAQRITLMQGDMREFQIAQHFDRVIIPFNGIYCMMSEAAVIDCLRCAGQHLTAQGKLIFDMYAIDDFHIHADPHDSDDEEAVHPPIQWHGVLYDVYESCVWDRDQQRLDVRYRHVPQNGGETVFAALSHRYLLTSQLHTICAQAGLVLEELNQDFIGTPLSKDAEHMLCTARRR